MSGDLIPHQQAAVVQAVQSLDVFGRTRPRRATTRRMQHEVEEALVSLFKIERAKQTAVAGVLAEDQLRRLARAVGGGNPETQMMADDYLAALHGVGVAQTLKAGS